MQITFRMLAANSLLGSFFSVYVCKTSDACASVLQSRSESKHRYARTVHLLQNKGEKQGSEVVSLQQTVAFLSPAAVDDGQNLGVVGNHTHPVLQHNNVKLSNFPAYRASDTSHQLRTCSTTTDFFLNVNNLKIICHLKFR